ncbi:MAG: hypothetical protein JWL77_6957 [Chthonomonadaceae bacterium]|nr:hypothetical protein [Chthonomonadaceae bacterium]
MRPDARFDRTMQGLERSLTVSHVSTADLSTAFPKQQVRTVRAWASAAAINNVPVRRDTAIVGVVENILGDLSQTRRVPAPPDDDASVADAARPLGSDMLIEGSQPLAEIVDELLKPPHYRLVLEGGRLDSIVTPSDLGKLPMRVLVFTQIAHMESTVTDAIRRRYETEQDAIDALGVDGRAQVMGKVRDMKDKNLDPSVLELASLRQKAQIAAACGIFAGDRDELDAQFKDLYERLRNPLMHAATFVDDSLEALVRLSGHLHFIRERTAEALGA